MKRILLALALTSFAAVAFGAPKAAAPRFSALPAGKVLPAPLRSSAPRQIAKTERAPYFSLSAARSQIAYLLPSDAEARAYASHGATAPARRDACYVVQRAHVTGPDWAPSFEARPHLVSEGSGAAIAARYERFVIGKPARLEIADAWIDPSSGGTRSIARSTLSLSRVADGPRGVRVYAARDGRSVHFVVTPADNDVPSLQKGFGSKVLGALLPGNGGDHRRAFLESITGIMDIAHPDGETGRSDCGHARVRLDADGGGSVATVGVQVVLSPPKDEAENMDAPAREIRMRTLDVHLSLSQLSADREPIYSVSFGWHGKPRSVPF